MMLRNLLDRRDHAAARAAARRPLPARILEPALGSCRAAGVAIVVCASIGVGVSVPSSARAQDADRTIARLGLDPGEPQAPSPTPATPFGVNPAQSKELVLDFHGYLLLPMELGVLHRQQTAPGQSSYVLHAPAVIPQWQEGFEYTGVIPSPWAQLNFTYGNSLVSATTILAATTFADAAGYYDTTKQLGVNDAFITVNISKLAQITFPFEVHVGAMTGRYGAMGVYDVGRYGTPLIAQTNTIGETIDTAIPIGPVHLLLEQGFGGQLARPPVGLVPAGWNGFANSNVGATWVNHLHAGLADDKHFQVGLHYLTAWTQDDITPGSVIPDGRITVLGAEAHVTGQFGHLYAGIANTQATNAGPVSGAIRILNAQGGPDLVTEYLGPNSSGNGSLLTFGAQYDVSVSRLLFGPTYKGKSPDILVSLFGIGTSVHSHDKAYDGILKIKVGAEATYNFLPWMGVSERFDHVRLDSSDSRQAFSILSSRLLLHTNWLARDEIALQYSYFSDGSAVYVHSGYPPVIHPEITPDASVLSLIATIWW
jgi:hypothetical protein